MQWFFALLIPLVLAIPAQARTVESFTYKAWRGGALTNDGTGQFQSCYIETTYNSGISLYLMMIANGTNSIALLNPEWSLTKGKIYHVTIKIDQIYEQYVKAIGVNDHMLGIYWTDSDSLITALQRGNRLTVRTEQNRSFAFHLTDTMPALARVEECMRSHKGRSDPFAAAPSRGTPADGVPSDPFSRPPAAVPSANPGPQPQQARTDAEQYIRSLFARPGFETFRILPQQEAKPEDRWIWDVFNVIWLSGTNTLGGFQNHPTPEAVEIGIAQMTAIMTRECANGQFGSYLKHRHVGDLDTRMLVTFCNGPNGLQGYFSFYPLKSGGYDIFGNVSKIAGDAEKADALIAETIGDIRIQHNP